MNEHNTAESPLPSDEDLLARARKGDAEAFGDLYERYLGPIYRYLYYRVGNVHEAEDLTETVFLKIWQSLASYRQGRASFRTWLFAVAHNLLVDHYRTRRREEALSEGGELISGDPQPEETVMHQERSQLISRVLQSLPLSFQEVLSLRFINGLKHEEAAAILGKSVGAVRVLQHRALKAFEEKMRQWGVEHV
jgi:RNA polymerase sigma-70 factor (ECF subfamily)